MSVQNWGFADGHGNEITRGWQGHADQARALAQLWANERKDVVDYWIEGSSTGDDEQERPSYSCSPESRVERQERIALALADGEDGA